MAKTKKKMTKKTTKKPAKRLRRKQCTLKGCRKGREDGSEYCRDHQEVPADLREPGDAVKRLTEIERLRFNESDTTLRNYAQEIKILAQEQTIEHATYEAKRRARTQRTEELKAAIAACATEQRVLLAALSKKYGFEPERTSIDDKTGVIQEHPRAK